MHHRLVKDLQRAASQRNCCAKQLQRSKLLCWGAKLATSMTELANSQLMSSKRWRLSSTVALRCALATFQPVLPAPSLMDSDSAPDAWPLWRLALPRQRQQGHFWICESFHALHSSSVTLERQSLYHQCLDHQCLDCQCLDQLYRDPLLLDHLWLGHLQSRYAVLAPTLALRVSLQILSHTAACQASGHHLSLCLRHSAAEIVAVDVDISDVVLVLAILTRCLHQPRFKSFLRGFCASKQRS